MTHTAALGLTGGQDDLDGLSERVQTGRLALQSRCLRG